MSTHTLATRINSSRAIRWEEDRLYVLDQREIPVRTQWLEIRTPDEMISAIKGLSVRGAPLIGIGAAFALYRYALDGHTPTELRSAAERLRRARPTAINLMYAMDRMVLQLEDDRLTVPTLRETAFAIAIEDIELCERIARNGLDLMPDSGNVLTHCNTGGLATAGIGTALGVIAHAYAAGKRLHVYVNETRPLLQGSRLTAWELREDGIPATLICDNMAGSLMDKGKIDCVIVGSDRIALNGDFANKTGTYSLAVLAHYHGIPFYVAAPHTTLDAACRTGADIPIEERSPDEVRGFAFGGQNAISWSPADMPAYNPSFDVTPVKLVSGFVLDSGYFTGIDVQAGRMAAAFELRPPNR